MQNIRIMSCVLIFVTATITGCRAQVQSSEDAGVTIDLVVEPDELIVGNAVFAVRLTDQTGEPIDDAIVEVRGDMTHAGMSPVLASTSESEAGLYRIPFEWTMGGDWLIDVTVTLAEGGTVQERFEYSVAVDGDMNMQDSDNMTDSTPEMTPDGQGQ
jgi:hypothetical protein